MTLPPPPPPLGPPAGWYPDPDRPGALRYWDGASWAASGEPHHANGSFGEWFTATMQRWWSNVVAFLTIGTVTALPAAALSYVAGALLIRDLVVEFDDDSVRLIGWSNDRIAPASGVMILSGLIWLVGAVAAIRLSFDAHDTTSTRSDPSSKLASQIKIGVDALRGSFSALPRAIGWSMVGVAIALSVVTLFGLVLVFAPPLGILLGFALIPVGVWVWVRWAFYLVAAVDGSGNPFTRSAAVSAGRFWGTLGRLLVVALLAGVMSSVITQGVSLTYSLNTDRYVDIISTGSTDRVRVSSLFPPTYGLVLSVLSSVATFAISAATTVGMTLLYRQRHPRR